MTRAPAKRSRKARRPRRGRLFDIALAFALLIVAAAVVARIPEGPSEKTSGAARVADGDSLVIGGIRIRLEGIDAPELDQTCTRAGGDYPCGSEARRALARLIGNAQVSCESRRQDRYGRRLARCTAAGNDLNRAMVAEGWAIAYGDYDDAEAQARQARRGLWSGSFERPQEWRRIHGGLAEGPHGGLRGWLRGLLSGWHTGEEERGDAFDEAV